MSVVYDSPRETLKQLQGHKTGNYLEDLFTDIVSGGISRNPDGSIDRSGLAWALQWREKPGAAEAILSTKEQAAVNSAIQDLVSRHDFSSSELLAANGGKKFKTLEEARSGIIKARQKRQNTPSEKERYTRRRQANLDELAASRLAWEQETQKWREQTALEDRRTARQDKKDNLALRIAEMAAQRESNERLELRGMENDLSKAQLENARLIQAENNARADRKEKAMMTLLGAGLDGLNAAMGMVF